MKGLEAAMDNIHDNATRLVDSDSSTGLSRASVNTGFRQTLRVGERRGCRDRRVSPAADRLRKGLWLGFYRETELDKANLLSPNAGWKVKTALMTEAKKYRYTLDHGGEVRAEVILPIVVEQVLSRSMGIELAAVHVVESVAKELASRYRVTLLDRRSGADRRK